MVRIATRPAPWAEHICHPLPLAAVFLLALNDQVLKGAGLLPASITGKLSDVAGLFFFPLLLSALLRMGRGITGRGAHDHSSIAALSILSTAAVFAGIKLSPAFNGLVARLWGNNELDATDLWALFALFPSWLWMRRSHGPASGNALQLGAVAAAALASMATSAPRYWRNYPRWTVQSPSVQELGCARGEIWFMKSGKQGAGATLQLSTREQSCGVRVTKATLILGGQTILASGLPLSVALSKETPRREQYLAFLFDGDEAWNAGRRQGTMQLELTAGGAAKTWDLPVLNELPGGEVYLRDPTWGRCPPEGEKPAAPDGGQPGSEDRGRCNP